MNRKLYLQEIDPVDIYGVNNKLFDLFASHFPKVKAVARGSEITLVGAAADLDDFEVRFDTLCRLKATKPALTEYDVESLFEGDGAPRNPEMGQVDLSEGNEHIIVYSNEGRAIRARTKTRRNWCGNTTATTCSSPWDRPERARPIRPSPWPSVR